ncbi:MAG: hypothetical protein KatS3mg035_1728 [Bacteroidia bacterium]|nr:MAG: hypothetical protein KatS3mg035_1728 [Bacteroidia bacterium]
MTPLMIDFLWLNNQSGTGNLPSLEVMCITEDREGQIWIGTEKGRSAS